MSDFRRLGFLRAGHGILLAAKIWHKETFSEIERKAGPAVNAHGPLSQASLLAFEKYKRLISSVAKRLNVLLSDGDLRSFFFNPQFAGRFEAVPTAHWSEPRSVDELVRLFFEDYEIQSSSSHPVVPRDLLYFSRSDLAESLHLEFARRWPFPKIALDPLGKKELADALQSLSEQRPMLRRPDQFEAVQKLPEFRQYQITDADLREAARKAPLRPGRPRKK
jgi:hypothetical protein